MYPNHQAIARKFGRYFLIGFPILFFGCTTAAPPPRLEPQTGASHSGVSQFVTIPPVPREDVYHVVAPMETLWRISKTYDVDQQAIIAANRLKDPKAISVGQKLLIPQAERARGVIPLYNTRPWDYIVIHHSATDMGNAISIDRLHHRRGFWNGLGYHFLIDNGTLGKQTGQIETGPRWIKQMDGAHCNAAGMNERGIGICLIGNFSETNVPEEQLNSLVFLVHALRTHYRIPLERILKHGEVPGKATECPGTHFPWQEFKRRLAQSPPGHSS